ncbi:MAG TPA: hypothetical protein VM686_09565, partial [Polyangiaceae bacterium]|nr:hypothetical protein [Polyangiaceae bacterium]
LLKAVRSLELLAGFCYTQFADTYQEANGLLHADRTPKIPIEVIAEATSGSPTGLPAADLGPEKPIKPEHEMEEPSATPHEGPPDPFDAGPHTRH